MSRSRFLRISMEEMLSVDQLHEAEETAKKDSEYDISYAKDAIIKHIEEQSGEDTGESSDTEATPNGDAESSTSEGDDSVEDKPKDTDSSEEATDEPEDSEAKDEDAEPEDSKEEKEAKVSTEAMVNLGYELSLGLEEGYGDKWHDNLGSKTGHVVWEGAKLAGNSAMWLGSALGALGIKYGPSVAKHVYKGVLYTMGKIAKVVTVGTSHLMLYTYRRINSFKNLRKDVQSLRKMLDSIESESTAAEIPYNKDRTINQLKIGDSIDFAKNISTLSTWVDTAIKALSSEVSRDISVMNQIMIYAKSGHSSFPMRMMTQHDIAKIASPSHIQGYELADGLIESFASKTVLPGDVRLIAYLPKASLSTKDEITDAYQHSKVLIGFDQASFKTVSSVDRLDKAGLTALLDSIEHLCMVCMNHEHEYQNIVNKKNMMRVGIKNYFNQIISSHTKITIRDSLVEELHLKSVFIDRIYVGSMMQLHDYCVKVINTGLSFAKDGIKHIG